MVWMCVCVSHWYENVTKFSSRAELARAICNLADFFIVVVVSLSSSIEAAEKKGFLANQKSTLRIDCREASVNQHEYQ